MHGHCQLCRGGTAECEPTLDLLQGRTLLWAWLQERRLPGVVGDYSGCLTLPRQLAVAPDGRRLLQQPAPEVSLLRRRASACGDGAPGAGSKAGGAPCAGPHTAAWYAEGVEVPEVQPLWVDGPSGQQLDVELVLRRWVGGWFSSHRKEACVHLKVLQQHQRVPRMHQRLGPPLGFLMTRHVLKGCSGAEPGGRTQGWVELWQVCLTDGVTARADLAC